ncbi:Gfo/Idh/MocA family protein [Aspergillus glaucus CBS 516.65]|uniref:Gfo/Idh/MocA-like oxidoreductase N-terminal domain-containing protein n=1 Tax=Aspergillus glaucus CBS 516.65 TaxID=1160497 RepID=A0A1L9VX74_ASPGL|nr:hypothetical protein ASPGLDRAFT_42080 [Aspergillus glaucus CBS 516.65]OJJ88505.1 hypothetical protein ASPGLDRAFT_42080 [Aspergillus glaucus CBS 516.65]
MQHDFKIGMAIIGSGNFAREEHLPSIIDSSGWGCVLKAVYSRSLQSAEKLAEGIPATVEKIKREYGKVPDVDIYSDDSGPGKGYKDLLARDDIMAVTIALPITIQPEYIRLAIQAGKHVFSEKPIAKDVATAIDLIRWYRSQTGPDRKILWAVGENWRWMDKYKKTAAEVGLHGLDSFRVKVHSMIKPDSKYHKTEWRRHSDYQGGFLLDGGVHVIAAIRLILNETAHAHPLTEVSAQCSLRQPHLAPIDTIQATLGTKNGTQGTLSLSYGSESNDQIYEFNYGSSPITLDGDTLTNQGEIAFNGRGVTSEIRIFAYSILEKSGVVHQSMSPEEALADLEVMEKMIQSSERGGGKMTLEYQVWH